MSQKKQSLHDTAALRALAGGEDLLGEYEEDYVSDAQEQSAKTSYTVLAGAKEEQVPQSGSHNKSTKSTEIPSSNVPSKRGTTTPRGGGNRFTNRPNYHVGIQFRKTIIPLLLLMALVLIALGVFTLVKVNNSSPEVIANNPFLDNGTLFAGVSITLGVCLIAGSIFFHYEVRKHHRENGGGKQ
jgi:hypothetical protein